MSWWTQRSVRERRLLTVMAGLIAVLLIWLAAIRPLVNARATAQARLTAATNALAQARADAAVSSRSAASPMAVAPRPLAPFVTQSAVEQGFTNMNVTGDRDDVAAITSAQVRPAAFFGWLGQLEARGVIVRSLDASASADQTISVRASLSAVAR